METKKVIPIKVQWAPGIANGALQMVYSLGGAYMAFFITDICLLSPGIMGSISLISSISTFLATFLWGAVFQYSNTKFGRYRPWLLVLPVFIFAGYAIIFTYWGINPILWAAIIIIGYSIANVAMRGLGVANSSLTFKIGDTEDQRKGMVLIKNGIHVTVRVISAAIFLPFVIFVGGSNTAPSGYFAYFAGFSLLTIFGYLYFNRVSKSYDTYDPNFKPGGTRVSIGDVIKTLGKNRQLLMFFMFQFICELCILCKPLGMVYFLRYVCNNFAMMTVYTALSPFAALLATFAAAFLLKKYDKIKINIANFSLQAIILLGIAIPAFIAGSFNVVIFLVLIVLADFLDGLQRSLLPLYYMDLTEYSYNKTGNDITPIVMALQGLPFSFAFMACGSIVGAILAATGYVANQVQTRPAINGIVLAVMVIPVFGLLEFIVMLIKGYKLNRAEMTKIYAENTEKKAAAKAEADKQ